jgi:pimeloyl-ACP methyl ester carboxylesterase
MVLAGLLIAVFLAAFPLAGCGGDDEREVAPPTSTATTTAAANRLKDTAVSLCGKPAADWRRLEVRAGSQEVQAATGGAGRTGFVFANDSNNDPCTWLTYADRLAADGARVAVFRYGEIGSPEQLGATALALRRAGAERIVAIGASVGGRAVVELAARHSPGVDAVVSLSGERAVAQYPDILPEARRVELPVLYAGSRRDGYTTFGKETVQLHEATPAKLNEILLVPGSDHGVDLLAGPGSERVRAAIAGFVANALGER